MIYGRVKQNNTYIKKREIKKKKVSLNTVTFF